MKYAIIAAGEGSRLAAEGIKEPKPLVKICGEVMIDRLIRIFMDNEASEIVIICNDLTALVAEHLQEIQANGLHGQAIPLKIVVKSTPSSMHSFKEISSFLTQEPFVLTTVDTIFREDEFRHYVKSFQQASGIHLFGVTDYIDDEKPLYVKTDEKRRIENFLDQNDGTCRFISGGIYGLQPSAIQTLNQCIARGEARMRNFQRALIRDQHHIQAFVFSKVLDIDHASDITKAEAFLK